MANAEFKEVLKVDRDKLFDVIVKYEDYPDFVDGCTEVKIKSKAKGKACVAYKVSMIKDARYTLDHVEDREKGIVTWTLIEGDLIKKNNGRWELKSVGPGKTEIRYTVEIEFAIPVPGLILNRMVKSSLPKMVQGFVERANEEA